MADMILSDAQTIAPGPSGSTSSVADVSTGQGIAFTPRTDKVLLSVNGPAWMNTAGSQGLLYMAYNTTGVPSQGSGSSDPNAGYTSNIIKNGEQVTISFSSVVTGLTPGTKYYFYLAASANQSNDTLNYGDFVFTARSV